MTKVLGNHERVIERELLIERESERERERERERIQGCNVFEPS